MVTWMAWHTWFWLQDDGELFGIFHSVLEFRSQLISLHSDPFSLEGPLGIVRRQSPQESNANIRFSLERWVTRYSPPMYSLGDVSMQSQQGSKVIDVFCFACKSHFKSRMSTAYYILRHEKRQCHQINIQQNVSVWADWCDWFMWSCVQNVWLHRLTKLHPCVFGWEMIWVPSWSFHHSKTATKGNFCIFSHLTIWYVLSCIICCCFISGDVRGCLVLPRLLLLCHQHGRRRAAINYQPHQQCISNDCWCVFKYFVLFFGFLDPGEGIWSKMIQEYPRPSNLSDMVLQWQQNKCMAAAWLLWFDVVIFAIFCNILWIVV